MAAGKRSHDGEVVYKKLSKYEDINFSLEDITVDNANTKMTWNYSNIQLMREIGKFRCPIITVILLFEARASRDDKRNIKKFIVESTINPTANLVSMTWINDNKLVLEICDACCLRAFISNSSICELKVRFLFAKENVFTKCIVRNIDKEFPLKEFAAQLFDSGWCPVQISHLKNSRYPSSTKCNVLVILVGIQYPEYVRIDYEVHMCDAFVENLLICGICGQFGHPVKYCKNLKCKDCLGHHLGKNCGSCINCGKSNCEGENVCEKIIKEQKVLEIMQDKHFTRFQALNEIKLRERRDLYANKVKGNANTRERMNNFNVEAFTQSITKVISTQLEAITNTLTLNMQSLVANAIMELTNATNRAMELNKILTKQVEASIEPSYEPLLQDGNSEVIGTDVIAPNVATLLNTNLLDKDLSISVKAPVKEVVPIESKTLKNKKSKLKSINSSGKKIRITNGCTMLNQVLEEDISDEGCLNDYSNINDDVIVMEEGSNEMHLDPACSQTDSEKALDDDTY